VVPMTLNDYISIPSDRNQPKLPSVSSSKSCEKSIFLSISASADSGMRRGSWLFFADLLDLELFLLSATSVN